MTSTVKHEVLHKLLNPLRKFFIAILNFLDTASAQE